MTHARLCLLSLLAAAALLTPAPGLADAGADPPTVTDPALTLDAALGLALRDNVSLKRASADADAATATARGSQAQTRPSLSTTTYAAVGDSPNILTSSPGVTPQNILGIAPRGFADQNIMLMVPLLTGGALGDSLAAARSQGDAARLSLAASRLAVMGAVEEDYTNAALAQALVTVAQTRLDAEGEQVRVTQERVTTGRSAPVDLLREQAERADAQQALLAAQNNVALALVNLKTALGISQESNIGLSESLADLSVSGAALPATLADALRQAEANRPELAAAQRQVAAARAAVGAARGEETPQVYGVAMADATAGQDIGRVGYTVGLTASLPLYDGGQRRADVDGAGARLARARADAEQARQTVEQEVATAWLNLQTTTARLAAARPGVTAAQQDFDLADLRYNAGKSVTAERLDALAALVRAQGSLNQAEADLIIAHVRLDTALDVKHQ